MSETTETYRYGIVKTQDVDLREYDSAQTALEIVVMWGDAVLLCEYVARDQSFVLGGPQQKGAELHLANHPEGIAIVENGMLLIPSLREGLVSISQDGETLTRTFQELRDGGQLQDGAYRLPERATAECALEGFRVLVRPTHLATPIGLPASLKKKEGVLGLLAMPFTAFSGASNGERAYTLGAAGIHLLVMLVFWFVPPRPSALAADRLLDDERFVHYLESPPETETIEPVASEAGPAGGGESGQAHAGESGEMGSETATAHNRRYAIQGHADHTELARESSAVQAANTGAIGILASMTESWNVPTSEFGSNVALGSEAMNALGNLMGEQVGDSMGYNGLGPHGHGRGGGGDGEGTLGLDRIGTIGTRGNSHGPGYGNGCPTCGLGGRPDRVPGTIEVGPPTIIGTLSAEVIRTAIRRQLSQVRFCYEQQLALQPDLSGRVTVQFVISPTGAVSQSVVSASGTTLGNGTAEQCIARVVQRIRFPQPENGGVVGVTYPFTLEAN